MMAVELGEAFRRHRGALTAAAMRVSRRHCGCSATTVKRRLAEVRGLLEAALE
jgi:hypothetical protein